MTWRDRLQKASFKGVKFWINGTTAEKGRRVSVRKLAGKDGSVQQDLGREPDAFDVEAFLWGDDYDFDRDDLEAKLLESGPGALVLPWRGEIWCRVTRGPITTESKEDGGFCTVRFSVVQEEREDSGLSALADTAGRLRKAAKALKDAAATDFEAIANTASMPSKYLRATINAIDSCTSTLREVQRTIAGGLGAIDDVTSAIDELDNAINTLLSTPSALLSKLQDLTDTIFGLADKSKKRINRTTGLVSSDEKPFEKANSVRTTRLIGLMVAGLGADSPQSADTELGQQSADNTLAVFRLVRVTAVARSAETYADAPFDSSTLALSVLESVGTEIDDLLEFGPSDDLFQSLLDLRAELSNHLTTAAASLPKAVSFTPPQITPACLIAHQLYGDARLEGDIVARNLPEHPLFIERAIEVIEP